MVYSQQTCYTGRFLTQQDILKVDFHGLVFGYHTLTHVKFNNVNKIEARYKMLRLNVKLSEVQLLCLLATVHALPLFYLRTQILLTHVRKIYATVERSEEEINS